MQLLNTLIVLATCLVVLHLLVVAVPALSRALLVGRFVTIRDQVQDAILDGNIEDSPAAREFVAKAELVLDDPDVVCLRRGLALHLALRRQGTGLPAEVARHVKEHHDVTPDDAQFIAERDELAVAALSRHFVRGSSVWFVLWPAQVVFRLVRWARGLFGHRTKTPTPGPRTLAQESWVLDQRMRDRVA